MASLVRSDVSGGGGGELGGNNAGPENCLLEQLRVSQNWRHLVNVEQSGQIKLNLREQVSARL